MKIELTHVEIGVILKELKKTGDKTKNESYHRYLRNLRGRIENDARKCEPGIKF